ncbi:ECF transporter S component, folate family [Atopostipes suicloacalis DSM 15692]|uniref:ECF transporter S component, folate family n=1 Tax=Atopostipes suicloacalis DSM 15692 TaxID=1121025 RepID=A0A1M4XMV0_9LACT|nr:folate family ECF transporter S component [Atopostipes suicloacalis]SHE94768.1 ECF transporter S component, folate family [Atopostipes suicloacalis DSM 15692]
MKENKKKFTFTIQQIAVLGVLMALELAISRVSILLGPSNRLTFGFIIHAVIGMLYGPWVAGFAAAGSDLLKSFLFGVQGQFFIGFTLTAFVGSFIYGLFLHRKHIRWHHIFWAVLLNSIFTNLLLNTLWLNLLYQTPFPVLLASRIPQNLIMGPIRFLGIYLIAQNRQLKRIFEKYGTMNK